jgi:hypothetical protein
MKVHTKYYALMCFIFCYCACANHENTDVLTKHPPLHIYKRNVIEKKQCVFSTEKPKPQWVDRHFFEDNAYNYAVGFAQVKDDITLQTKAAELVAKQILSENRRIHLDSQFASVDTNSQTSINDRVQTSTQSIFFHSKIIDVWKDGQNCLIYVLIRQPK